MVIGVDDRLIVHRRVNRGDRDVIEPDGIVEQLEQRYATVGSAGRVGDQSFGSRQLLMVDAHDHRGIDISCPAHGLRKQHAWNTSRKKALPAGTRVVGTGTLEHEVHTQVAPIDRFWRRLAQDLYAVAVKMQTIAFHRHVAGKAAMGRVETGEVLKTGHVGEVVEGDDLEIEGRVALVEGTQHAATNATVAVEGNAVGDSSGHSRLALCELEAGSQTLEMAHAATTPMLSRHFSAAVISQT